MKRKTKTNTKIIALIFSICLSVSLFGILPGSVVEAKAWAETEAKGEAPLTLQEIKTALANKNTPKATKNKLITDEVKKRGVNFILTSENEQQLRNAGANSELIEAIRQNPPPPPAQCEVFIDNYTKWYVQIWVDGAYKGTVAPYGETSYYTTAKAGTVITARTPNFPDGTYFYWDPITYKYCGNDKDLYIHHELYP